MIFNRLSQKELFAVSENITYVDIIDEIAFKQAVLYMGNGIEFKHNDEAIHKQWHDMEKLNNFADVMFFCEKLMSRNGAVFLTINKNKEGKALLNIANIYFPNFVNKCFANETQAILYEQFNLDNEIRIMRSQYDTEKVVRYLVDKDNNKESRMQEFVSKLPEEYQVQLGEFDPNTQSYTYYHNLGFIPVCCMVNKPLPTTFFPILFAPTVYQSPFESTYKEWLGDWSYAALKDTADCKGLISAYQVMHSLRLQNAILDRTRVYLYGITQAEKDRNNEAAGSMDWVLDKSVVNVGYGNLGMGIGGVNGNVMQVAKPANNLSMFDDTLSNMAREIYRVCGMSYLVQTANQKTSTESYAQYKEDLQTLYFKQFWHTKQWKQVIWKMFKMQDVELKNTEWSFQVKKNNIIDIANNVDNMIKKIQAGVETPETFISMEKQVDEDQAKQIWENNKKWFKKNDYQVQMKEGAGANAVNTKPANAPKGARPQEKGGK